MRIVCGVWERGWAGQVVFSSGVCAKEPKVQIYPKTLVHDCRCFYSHVLSILRPFLFIMAIILVSVQVLLSFVL